MIVLLGSTSAVMVADARRKEARKRKFGANTSERRSITSFGQENEAGGPANKKSKPDVSNPGAPPNATENDETSCTLVETDKVADNLDSASAKNQRFIVFIGQFHFTVKYPTFLSDAIYYRKPALHSNRQVYQ